METNATRGELTLALMIYRALTPENQKLALALVEAMKESQGANAGSMASAMNRTFSKRDMPALPVVWYETASMSS